MADETESVVPVLLPSGEVEVTALFGGPADAAELVAVAPGAGAGPQHPFLAGVARGLQARGFATVRFAFPYQQAGRRMPGPASHAIATWRAVAARCEADGRGLWATGKSYGGRMASMAAAAGEIAPSGLVYLGYPLHPPGDPAKTRAAHLPDVAAPQLFVSGTTDPFIQPIAAFEEAVATCRDAEVRWIDGGGHSFEVKGHRRPADVIGADLADPVADWIEAVRARG